MSRKLNWRPSRQCPRKGRHLLANQPSLANCGTAEAFSTESKPMRILPWTDAIPTARDADAIRYARHHRVVALHVHSQIVIPFHLNGGRS